MTARKSMYHGTLLAIVTSAMFVGPTALAVEQPAAAASEKGAEVENAPADSNDDDELSV